MAPLQRKLSRVLETLVAEPRMMSFLSAHVAVTKGGWCDVAWFFFFSFPFCWLLGAHSPRALPSCAPKGIYDSQQGRLKFELVSIQNPSLLPKRCKLIHQTFFKKEQQKNLLVTLENIFLHESFPGCVSRAREHPSPPATFISVCSANVLRDSSLEKCPQSKPDSTEISAAARGLWFCFVGVGKN